MAYITLANSSKIVFNSEIKDLDLSGTIYKTHISFFNKFDTNSLLAIKELLKDPVKYFSTIYKPYKPVDTYSFVYEGQPPSYHSNTNCPRLNSIYENFEIPSEIKKKGPEMVKQFRAWFETVKHLLEKPDVFVARLQARWGIVTNPNAIRIENSGALDFGSFTLAEIEAKIDALLKESSSFTNSSEKNRTILSQFSKNTYLGRSNSRINNNSTSYSDEEVKALLRNYDNNYKKPTKRLLVEYYRLKYNPDVKLEETLLSHIGFRMCSLCYGQEIIELIQNPIPKNDHGPSYDLPF